MIRLSLWLLAGVLFGALIHIVIILTIPALSETSTWDRLNALGARGTIVVLEPVVPGAPNPMRLDPELVYGVCLFDVTERAGRLSGVLPLAFWSVAVFRPNGSVLYSTTSREGTSDRLLLGVFTEAQTRQLAQQDTDIEEGLIIVESDATEVAVVVRLAPPHPAMQARYRDVVAQMNCS
jgi:uncharacterized membrane protein